MDYEHLDKIALEVAKGQFERTGVLSTGEKLYVALAANSFKLLKESGYTIAEAIERLGDEGTSSFVERWRYRGNPENF